MPETLELVLQSAKPIIDRQDLLERMQNKIRMLEYIQTCSNLDYALSSSICTDRNRRQETLKIELPRDLVMVRYKDQAIWVRSSMADAFKLDMVQILYRR